MCGNSFWVELITLLYHICYSLIEPSIKVHIYESICQVENFTDCNYLLENKELEDAVHEYSANTIVHLKLLRTLPALLIIIFCGAWSDDIGRKLPILFPFIGMLLSLFLYLLSYVNTIDTTSTILVGGLLSGLFGEAGLILMAGYSYVTELTEMADRTRRLGRLMAMSFFGQFLGSLIVAIMIKFTIARNVFILATILCCLSIVVIITFLQDSLLGKERQSYILCRPQYLMETWGVISMPRENKKRKYIILILLSIAIHQACLSGELDVAMLFTRHRPLHWNSSEYGYYLMGGFLCSGLGTLLLLPLLAVRFNINDFTLSIAAVIFKVVHMCWMAFSIKKWMVYFGLPLMIVSSMFVPGLKSLLSKLINNDEIGRIFGVSAFGETLSTLFGAFILTAVYGASVQLFSGLAFIIEALVNIGIIGCLWWLSVDYKRHHHSLVIDNPETKTDQDAEQAQISANGITTEDKEGYNAIRLGYDQPKAPPRPPIRPQLSTASGVSEAVTEDSDDSEYGPTEPQESISSEGPPREIPSQHDSYRY